jgi:MOSC domain-containing protein YiiM
LCLCLHESWRPEGERRNNDGRRKDAHGHSFSSLKNHLVGRRFWLGETLLEATRLTESCRHIEKVTGKAIAKHLINRAGLYCKILDGGIVKVGDTVRAANRCHQAPR